MTSPVLKDKPLLLLVDDVPANLKLLESSLREQFRLKLATSGALALELARKDDKPDLILLDLRMPEMSGAEVLQHLRADTRTQDIPVIFATADHSVEVESVGLSLGADDYVTKPISIPVLLARIQNILRRKTAEKLLRISEMHFRNLFESMDEGVIYFDEKGSITQANPAALSILGIRMDQALGSSPKSNPWKAIHRDGRPIAPDEYPSSIASKTHEAVHRRVMGIFNTVRQDYSWLQISATPRFEPETNRFVGVFVSFADITELRALEQKLEHLATMDALTGIRNRRSFFEQAEHEFVRARRQDGSMAMVMMDLDHFKHINDTYGHAVGDEVLKHFTQLVSTRMRESDLFGRVGGEEFAMLLPDTNQEGALSFANQLLAALRNSSVPNEAGPISYTVSIGLAMSGAMDTTPDSVLYRADQALYRAKKEGRDRVVVVNAASANPG